MTANYRQRFSRRHRNIPVCAAFAVMALALFSCIHRATINGAEVRSIRMADNNGTATATLSSGDMRAVAGFLSEAVYDSLLNDSGIAVKMAAPDYTLVVSYRTAGAQEDWAQIWSESGRTLFRTKWYFLREADLPKTTAILKKYHDI